MAFERMAMVTSPGSTPKMRAAVIAVDVRPRPEGLDQPRVLGQVGDDPQLDLVVVGDQEAACPPRARRHCRSWRPSSLRIGMLCRLGCIRREPSGAGHRLVERGVDPPVRRHLGQQRSP